MLSHSLQISHYKYIIFASTSAMPTLIHKIKILHKIKNKNYYYYYFKIQEEPETLGEVVGNKGKSRGSDSLGVVEGDGCK